MFKVGDYAYLAREIIEPACEDHPDFLMGRKGERVLILSKEDGHTYPYSVEGPTNPDKPWLAKSRDLMRTKPMRFN